MNITSTVIHPEYLEKGWDDGIKFTGGRDMALAEVEIKLSTFSKQQIEEL